MFALLLAVVLVLGLAAPAMAATTMRSVQKLTVNGEAVECDKYNIDGYNYFKLRDLAKLLDGTNSQFNVDYDQAAKMMVVTTGVPYTTPNGTELQVGEDQSASAVPSVQSLMIDGEMREDLTAYNIGGNNYFQLRELGKALHFYVHYDVASKTGTGEQADEEGGYREDAFVSSFVGFAPASDPEILVYVGLNNTPYLASGSAAPTFSSIMSEALTDMGIPPES